jgi:hypothetical protein
MKASKQEMKAANGAEFCCLDVDGRSCRVKKQTNQRLVDSKWPERWKLLFDLRRKKSRG